MKTRLEEIEKRLVEATQKCYCNDLYAGLCKSCWAAMDLGREDAADLLAVVKLQDEILKEVIRNSHDIVAKKLCSRTREEVEKILEDEV